MKTNDFYLYLPLYGVLCFGRRTKPNIRMQINPPAPLMFMAKGQPVTRVRFRWL